MTPIRLVYVSGVPRSGTTLVGMALGQMPGMANLGELWALWRPAYRNGDLCSCGRPVRDCEFWRSVVHEALGDQFESEGMQVGTLHSRALGTLRAPRAWLHAVGAWADPDLAEYATVLTRHYRAAAAVAGVGTVVDTSKMATDALVATTIGDIEVFVVHIVRDPRAVASSWGKTRRLAGPAGRHFDRRGPAEVSARWLYYNSVAELALRSRVGHDHFMTVRYEDLIAEPARQLRAVARWLGLPGDDLPVQDEPPALLMQHPTHAVWGNLVGNLTGPVPLRLDEGWRQDLRVPHQLLVSALSAPLLRHYRYPIMPGWRRRPGPPRR